MVDLTWHFEDQDLQHVQVLQLACGKKGTNIELNWFINHMINPKLPAPFTQKETVYTRDKVNIYSNM